MPAHHKLEAFLDEYVAAAGIRDDGKSPLAERCASVAVRQHGHADVISWLSQLSISFAIRSVGDRLIHRQLSGRPYALTMLSDQDALDVAEALLERLGVEALPVIQECAVMALEKRNLADFGAWVSVGRVIERLLRCKSEDGGWLH
jgi:hypothetical protein